MINDSKRQLNSILFADIVGYTSMMQKDETSATTLLRKFHHEIEENILDYRGEIVNFYGDGVLCVFSSPLDAVRYAMDIQLKFLEEPAVPVRVGIHNGTVVYEGDKVYGDSVNLASRIESLGNPGSILLSKKVRDEIKNNPELKITSLGAFRLKNVEEPMDIYALSNSPFVLPNRSEILTKLGNSSPFQWLWIFLIILLGLGTFGVKMIFFSSTKGEDIQGFHHLNNIQIALTQFENNTTNRDFDIIGKMATDWITHAIVENKVAPVISAEAIKNITNVSKASMLPNNIFKSFSGNIQVLEGTYFVDESNLIFQCSIVDADTRSPIHAFKQVSCTADRPLEGIEKLKDQILGYYVTQEKKQFASSPPTFTAYKYYLQAKEVWTEDDDLAENLLRKSIEADPDFYHSKVLLAHIFYNNQDYETLDSVVTSMEMEMDRSNYFQVNSVEYLRSLLDGDNRKIYDTYYIEYMTAPKDLFKNSAMMVVGTDFIKNPDLVVAIYNDINNELLDYKKCDYCAVRVGVMVRTLIGLNETEKAIDILESLIDETNSRHIFNPLVMAYVKKQKFEELDELLNKAESGIYRQNTNYLYFLGAYYAQLFGFEEAREKYAKLAIDRYKANNSRNQKMLGRSYYVLGDFTNAQKWFEQYLEDSPSDVFCKSKLAAIAFNRGNLDKAYNFISSIRKGRRPYDFGYSSYFIGQAFARSSHQDSALIYLKEAMLSGDRFSLIDYENDPFLADLHKTSDWLQFMDTWTINNDRED